MVYGIYMRPPYFPWSHNKDGQKAYLEFYFSCGLNRAPAFVAVRLLSITVLIPGKVREPDIYSIDHPLATTGHFLSTKQ